MEIHSQDTVVVGAGLVGLAIARALSRAGRDVLVIEAASTFGTGISSRNSEVIHSGIYYPSGSLKAKACVSGRRMLYDYCERRSIDHRRCGKIIVATDASEETRLEAVAVRAAENGVDDIRPLGRCEVEALEPNVRATAALFCPSTGIIDSHALMQSFVADIESEGGTILYKSKVSSLDARDGLMLRLAGDNDIALAADRVINSCGIAAAAFAASVIGPAAAQPVRARFAKGNYFSLRSGRPFRHLIYPLPQPGGLGVHATLDLGGAVRFGPDVEWVDDPNDYTVDASRADSFYAAVRRYFPGLQDGSLVPAYCGIRPKIIGEQGPIDDFVIQCEAVHGIPGLINMLGIESPGLTSCMALGEMVVAAICAPS